jgi:hypothetical protein
VQASVKVPHSVVAVVTLYSMAGRRSDCKYCYTARCSKSGSHSHSEAVKKSHVVTRWPRGQIRSERASDRCKVDDVVKSK